MIIGLISDTHIPNRAKNIPKEFLSWFEENCVDLIVHCGDVNDEEVIKQLEEVAEVKVVKGNTDYLDFLKCLKFKVSKWKVFVFHSSEVYPRGDLRQLYDIAKKNGANILIFGHTHLPLFTKYEDVYLINPGSATGVRSGEIPFAPKSVAILDLDDTIKVKFNLME